MGYSADLFDQSSEGKLRCPVNGNEEVLKAPASILDQIKVPDGRRCAVARATPMVWLLMTARTTSAVPPPDAEMQLSSRSTAQGDPNPGKIQTGNISLDQSDKKTFQQKDRGTLWPNMSLYKISNLRRNSASRAIYTVLPA